jgi:hypothetical protein
LAPEKSDAQALAAVFVILTLLVAAIAYAQNIFPGAPSLTTAGAAMTGPFTYTPPFTFLKWTANGTFISGDASGNLLLNGAQTGTGVQLQSNGTGLFDCGKTSSFSCTFYADPGNSAACDTSWSRLLLETCTAGVGMTAVTIGTSCTPIALPTAAHKLGWVLFEWNMASGTVVGDVNVELFLYSDSACTTLIPPTSTKPITEQAFFNSTSTGHNYVFDKLLPVRIGQVTTIYGKKVETFTACTGCSDTLQAIAENMYQD